MDETSDIRTYVGGKAVWKKMLFKLSELDSYVKIRLLLPTFCPEWKVMFPWQGRRRVSNIGRA